ncbi:Aminotransferase class V domain [Trinorchestia longiramus]|nr:Aminotransferase class V domain [Trinorchestia longiramus]
MVWMDLQSCKTSSICSTAAPRKFYSYEGSKDIRKLPEKCDEKAKLVQYVSENIIGSKMVFQSPFGPRKVVYCDFTATGRSLQFIEDHLTSEVLPNYGSTHTTATHTAMQTTMFRHEARDVVRNAVRASERDRVIFTGSGATGAAVRLLHGLNLSRAPVVLAGPFLHHSALLPWREAGAKVIRIREASDGSVDLHHLQQTLQLEARAGEAGQRSADAGGTPTLIGCFSAGSNVTGVLVDTVAVTVLLHKYGALSFWDYATAVDSAIRVIFGYNVPES